MEINELPVCQNTDEKPELSQKKWVCKKSDKEMRLENEQWVCDQCTEGGTKAGKQQQVHKPRPQSDVIADGKRKAREDFEKEKREKEADELEREEREEQERQNYPRPRGG